MSVKHWVSAVAALAALAGCGVDLPRDGPVDGSGPFDYALRSRHLDVDFVPVLRPDASITTMATRARDPALYLVAQEGIVYRFVPPTIDDLENGIDLENDASEVALDMSELTLAGGEEGFGGLAFDPSGTAAYVYHSREEDGHSVLAEYLVEPDGEFVEASRRELFVLEQSSAAHNGGQLLFGPDSMLYVGVGDGSSFSDLERVALGLTSPLGKILRIDPRPSAGLAYTVPADNPAVGLESADPRIWSRGLRNPSSFSFDAMTGDLWIADVGQERWEEINYAPAFEGRNAGRGLHFGWSAFEGRDRFNTDQSDGDHAEPLLVYEHPDPECGAVQDGLVVRDALVEELDGWYVYGDWCQGTIRAHDVRDPNRESVVIGEIMHFTQMLQATDGNLYVSSNNVFAGVDSGVFIVTSGE